MVAAALWALQLSAGAVMPVSQGESLELGVVVVMFAGCCWLSQCAVGWLDCQFCQGSVVG